MELGVKYQQGDTELRLAIKCSFTPQKLNNNNNNKSHTNTPHRVGKRVQPVRALAA